MECAKISAVLNIHTIFRTLQSLEPLERDFSLSLHKLSVEGRISENKTCLGWDIQTRSLRLFLPKEKETDYVQDIREYLDPNKINIENLESLIFKFNNSEHIISLENYFLT